MMMAPASLLRLLAEEPRAGRVDGRRRVPAATPRTRLLRRLLRTHRCEQVRARHA
jgi:hypothetical protein